MKSFEIWLKGGGSMVGTMGEEVAQLIRQNMATTGCIVDFIDGDGDTVIIRTFEIAAFVYRDKEPEKGIGYT